MSKVATCFKEVEITKENIILVQEKKILKD
jgi:hypothetical protein